MDFALLNRMFRRKLFALLNRTCTRKLVDRNLISNLVHNSEMS